MSENNEITRRSFLSKGVSAAGSLVFASGLGLSSGKSASAKVAPLISSLKLDSLRGKFKGRLITPVDPEFPVVALGGLWNELKPTRYPQLVAQVLDEADVAAAIRFARSNKLKVTVRGGGHNWCNPSVHNSGIMIDPTKMNQVISVDKAAKKAVLQPIISNRDVQKRLNAEGLSFPSGHCPEVKLSGYLLSGGMSWNQGVWGHGVGSVEAVELVTADGQLLTASATENQDYFFAARGAGPGLFAVATRYHLKLYDLPKAITASSYVYPYEHLEEVAQWVSGVAGTLPPSVELSLFMVNAPADLADKCKESGGKVCMVTATMFADSAEEAAQTLSRLDSCPLLPYVLKSSTCEPMTFEQLFDASGALWPSGLRCNVDAMFSDENLATVVASVKEHYKTHESPSTVVMFAVFTGKNVPEPLDPTMAFSMTARLYGGPWTMWKEASADERNIAWHKKCVELLSPHIKGHYVAESDTVANPEFSRTSYSQKNWQRLSELRAKYDPDGVFFDYNQGLT